MKKVPVFTKREIAMDFFTKERNVVLLMKKYNVGYDFILKTISTYLKDKDFMQEICVVEDKYIPVYKEPVFFGHKNTSYWSNEGEIVWNQPTFDELNKQEQNLIDLKL